MRGAPPRRANARVSAPDRGASRHKVARTLPESSALLALIFYSAISALASDPIHRAQQMSNMREWTSLDTGELFIRLAGNRQHAQLTVVAGYRACPGCRSLRALT